MNDNYVDLNLDALEATARAATPGPWIADPPSAWDTDDVGGYQLQAAVRVKDSGSITWDDHGGEVFKPADAEHIATFDPPTTLALIAEVRRLREAEEARDEFHAKALDAIHEKNRAQDALREAEAVIAKAQAILGEHLGLDHAVLAARTLATYNTTK